MIEKLSEIRWDMCPPECPAHCIEIALKLNEVIEAINAKAILDETTHSDVAKACQKAVRTGSHADLKAYLELRRKFL